MAPAPEIVWAAAADRDVALIFDYLDQRSTKAARGFLEEIFAAVDRLRQLPRLGKLSQLPVRRQYRELVVGVYKLFYLIEDEQQRIVVARIWDTRQDPTRFFLPRRSS